MSLKEFHLPEVVVRKRKKKLSQTDMARATGLSLYAIKLIEQDFSNAKIGWLRTYLKFLDYDIAVTHIFAESPPVIRRVGPR